MIELFGHLVRQSFEVRSGALLFVDPLENVVHLCFPSRVRQTLLLEEGELLVQFVLFSQDDSELLVGNHIEFVVVIVVAFDRFVEFIEAIVGEQRGELLFELVDEECEIVRLRLSGWGLAAVRAKCRG